MGLRANEVLRVTEHVLTCSLAAINVLHYINCACGTWDDEGLAEAHDVLDGREEEKAEERHRSRLDVSEYYGSEGFDRPPSDVYSYGGGYFGDDGAGA